MLNKRGGKIGQSEIIDFLKENKGKRFSVSQLSRRLGIRWSSIYNSLRNIRGKSISYDWIFNPQQRVGKFVYWIDVSNKIFAPEDEEKLKKFHTETEVKAIRDTEMKFEKIDELFEDIEFSLISLNKGCVSLTEDLKSINEHLIGIKIQHLAHFNKYPNKKKFIREVRDLNNNIRRLKRIKW